MHQSNGSNGFYPFANKTSTAMLNRLAVRDA